MRDWPEPDQDTSLDILDTWDLGDYEEARAERFEAECYEQQTKAEAEKQAEFDAYWDQAEYLLDKSEAEAEVLEEVPRWAIIEGEEYAEHQKTLEKLSEETHITKLDASTAKVRADIIQAEANIARIITNIAVAKSEIAKANYHRAATYGVDEEYYYACNWLANAETKLIDAETNLVEAEVVLTKARAIGAAHEAIVRAQTDVKYAEVKVQTKADAKNRAIEFEETFNSKFSADEEDSVVEDTHLEFINALIELAEAKDALDLAEVHLSQITPFCSIRGYGFASKEPRCPTSDTAE